MPSSFDGAFGGVRELDASDDGIAGPDEEDGDDDPACFREELLEEDPNK